MGENQSANAEIEELAALAERLPEEKRRSLAAELHLSANPTRNQGLLEALRYALRTARAANGTASDVLERLSEAAAVVAAQVRQGEVTEFRAIADKLRLEYTPERLQEIEEEIADSRARGQYYPFEQVIQEMEAIQKQHKP